MIAIPERNLIAMPTDMDPVAAALTEPIAVAMHAVALAAKAAPRPLSELRALVSGGGAIGLSARSEEHTSELQSLMRISYAVFCLKKKNTTRMIHSLSI